MPRLLAFRSPALLVLAMVLAPPGALSVHASARGTPEEPSRAARDGGDDPPTQPGSRYRFAVLAGATGLTGETPHYFGAFEAGRFRERFGGFTQLHGGGGSEFASVLAGVGPGAVLLERGPFDLVVHVGPGLYTETISTGTRRWTGVALAGLSTRIPVRGILLAAGFSAWRGHFSGTDFERPLRVRGLRLGFGVGWGWRS